MNYASDMRKFGGLLVVAASLALAGCTSSAPEPQQSETPVQKVAQVSASVQDSMILELRPLLKTLQENDAELARQGYEACANLLFRSKDDYRESVLKQYESDMTLALDHLTVAAAAKKYICPAT
jgi:hypothetical protein